jgi:hypothetical protein
MLGALRYRRRAAYRPRVAGGELHGPRAQQDEVARQGLPRGLSTATVTVAPLRVSVTESW